MMSGFALLNPAPTSEDQRGTSNEQHEKRETRNENQKRMLVPNPTVVELSALDETVAALPNQDAVFLVWAGERSAYLAKTSMLRRRLLRILKPAEPARRSLNLREVVTRVEYWLTASRIESTLLHYALAKRHYPEDYL